MNLKCKRPKKFSQNRKFLFIFMNDSLFENKVFNNDPLYRNNKMLLPFTKQKLNKVITHNRYHYHQIHFHLNQQIDKHLRNQIYFFARLLKR
jgi:hypothetical protein